MRKDNWINSLLAAKMKRKDFVKYAAIGVAAVISAGTDPAATAAPNPGELDASHRRARTVPVTNGVDDRAMIQAILDEGAGEVVFSAGRTWTIDSTAGTGGICPRSGTRIVIEDGAVLKVKSNTNAVGRLIDIGRDEAVQNVTVEGSGTLLGDVLTHIGSAGEWGHLIHITNGSANIQIVGPLLLKQAWGDGIYIGDGSSSINYDVLIDGVTVDDCRREGIAPFWVDGCTIRNCRVLNIGSTMSTGPGSGIDCEPNAGQLVNNLTIETNFIKSAAGCGIYVSANPGPVNNLIIRDNEVIDCGLTEDELAAYQTNGIHVAAIASPVLTGNTVRGSGYDGNLSGASGQIYLRSVTRPVLKGGNISGGLGRGILTTHCTAPEISDVMLEKNQYQGIAVHKSDGTVLRGNHLLDNVQVASDAIEHLLVQSSDNTITQGNVFRGDKGYSWVRIETPGDNNFVGDNAGLGNPPANVLIDEGARTVTVAGGVTLVG